MDARSILVIEVLGVAIALLNACISIWKRRGAALIAVEVGIYVALSACVLLFGFSTASLLMAAMIVLVGNTGLSRMILRNAAPEGAIRRMVIEERLSRRIELAEIRMADRERRAREEGVSVLEILKREQLNEGRRS